MTAAVGANANANADADVGGVVIVIPSAIPPPVAAVKGVNRLCPATTIPPAKDHLILTGIMKNGHE